ncbi:DUF803-domain-containing protein [Epithele typhae]|uniref:DUF803-domain-containing protein n=1 Tax=Epithele typhae TaxID=378194 RepID=UPI0020080DBD|nr:DUF803-domain-containing protein [Epithele typhae]KAH9913320.1 DUF803-domain-containing protein [Epithele typhae]
MSDSNQPSTYRAVGVVLAIGSGVLIGSSFVFKKKGLLASQKGHVAGEGVAYLKSPLWWTGMIIMILGELCNFGAYAFVEAIVVTPMGALSVVISSILSHFILKERLSLFGWISSFQCLLGASILAINAPDEQSVSTIEGFKHLFLAPWFLAYGGVVIAAAVFLAVYAAPKWGKKSMMPYLGVCSLIGGLSVSCTQGLGACIVTSIRGQNQFKNWFIYFLLIFVVITLLTEIYYLNVALAMFNTGKCPSDVHIVKCSNHFTPTYYVTFTFCTLVTSVILYQGLKASASEIITIVLAFVVICTGIVILQMTKVDPRKLSNVDEHTTLLLQAARQEADPNVAHDVQLAAEAPAHSIHDAHVLSDQGQDSTLPARSTDDLELGRAQSDTDDDWDFLEEKRAIVARSEEPGIDSLRMGGGLFGTIIRARRRATALSTASASRSHLSISGAGSMHSGNGTATVRRRDSLSPPPRANGGSWFRAFAHDRRPESRSPAHSPSALPDSPMSGSPPPSSNGLPSPSPSAGSLGLVHGESTIRANEEARTRRPSIRFQTGTASAPDVHVTLPIPTTLSRPSMGTRGADAGAARSRTMPSTFVDAERVGTEGVMDEKPGEGK